MPKCVINEGLESEVVIEAANAREDGIRWWFYDTQGNKKESRLKSFIETIKVVPQS